MKRVDGIKSKSVLELKQYGRYVVCVRIADLHPLSDGVLPETTTLSSLVTSISIYPNDTLNFTSHILTAHR